MTLLHGFPYRLEIYGKEVFLLKRQLIFPRLNAYWPVNEIKINILQLQIAVQMTNNILIQSLLYF